LCAQLQAYESFLRETVKHSLTAIYLKPKKTKYPPNTYVQNRKEKKGSYETKAENQSKSAAGKHAFV
jgi:hypothetical protein